MRRFTWGVAPPFSHDLHVLGTPPAFVLSQDQTLQLNLEAPWTVEAAVPEHVTLVDLGQDASALSEPHDRDLFRRIWKRCATI